jgi:hypothetical protein
LAHQLPRPAFKGGGAENKRQTGLVLGSSLPRDLVIPETKASALLLLVIATVVAMFAPAPAPASAANEPVTSAADSLRTGWYPDEAQLTPQLLQGGGFGRVFDTPVQGQVYAQPLVSGSTLLAATEDNWIYGINPQSGAIQWHRNVGTPWNSKDVSCPNPGPHVGITGTPVIDPATNVAYFFSKTYASGGSGPAVWNMHAVHLSNGEEVAGFPVPISGAAQNLPAVSFNPTRLLERPALLLMNGVVYAAFGSLCDRQPYEGWIVGVSTSGQIKAMWATAPAAASIWQSGGGMVSDGEGQILFASGNGSPPPAGLGGNPPEGKLGESVGRVVVQHDGTLKATDFFSPFDNTYLTSKDLDFGSGGPLGLPSAYFGTAAIPHLLVQMGKQGVIYLLNRDSLGGMGQGIKGGDAVVQEIPGTKGLWGSMAAWPGDGGYIYTPALGSLEVLKYGTENGAPHLSLVATSSEHLEFGSGSPLVTSNGTTAGSGIVWVSRCSNPSGCKGSTLNAYGAVPAGGSPQLLWSGEIGVSTRFARPDASGGRIYVGTYDGHLLGFGPTASHHSPPSAPTGVTASAATSQALVRWVQPSSNGGSAITGYTVTPHVGSTAQKSVEVGAGATSMIIKGLTNGTSYTFTVTAKNVVGSGSPSTASGAVVPHDTIFDFVTPATIDSGDTHSVELGVKFRSEVAGTVTGIRFYKAAANTGTHIGGLWSASGTLLASATFTGESASGWQQVNFSTPVAISANTTYVAGYLAPKGHYSDTSSAFVSVGVSNPPLRALANPVSADGVYSYSSSSTFPTRTYKATNYWVDVDFAA